MRFTDMENISDEQMAIGTKQESRVETTLDCDFENQVGINETKEVRLAYQALSKNIIYGESQKEVFNSVVKYEKELNQRFEYDGARLLINTTFNFAYLSPIKNEAGESEPNLLKTLKLNKYDSFLWVFLRSEFDKSMRVGGDAVLVHSQVLTQLNLVEPNTVQDKRKHDKAVNSAINKALENSVLKKFKKIGDEEQRYQIRPFITVVIGAEQIDAFLAQFQKEELATTEGDINV